MAEQNPERVSLESVVKMATAELYLLYAAHLIISVVFILYTHHLQIPTSTPSNFLKSAFHVASMCCFMANIFSVLFIMRLDMKSAKYMMAQSFEQAAELDKTSERISHFLALFVALGLAFLIPG